MTREEILLRRLSGQALWQPSEPLSVVSGLCGLQAQYLSHALHALSLRAPSPDTAGMVKSWTNRGTMHLFAEKDLPLFLHRNRTPFLRAVDTMESDSYISAARKQYFSQLILAAVGSGVERRSDLKKLCAGHGMADSESTSLFDPWGGIVRALCEDGKLCHKATQEKAYRLCPDFVPMEKEDAQLELARRYFTHYGPATIRDAAWFFGCTQQTVKHWLSRLPVQQDQYESTPIYWLESGTYVPQDLPPCIFLAGFDPFLLGYDKKGSLFLPQEHLRSIYTLSGIVRPAVLLQGRVAGFWNVKGQNMTISLFASGSHALLHREAENAFPGLRAISIV